jgi:hypothetical protein
MDEYNKLTKLKKEFSNLIYDLDTIKKDCIKNNSMVFNLDTRFDKICNCIKTNSKKTEDIIKRFKENNNINNDDNNIVYHELDKMIKAKEDNRLKSDFPLSDDTNWKFWFDNEYRRDGNYMKSYFTANNMILYKESRQTIDICMNHTTFDGTEYKADDLIRCIKKAKEL